MVVVIYESMDVGTQLHGIASTRNLNRRHTLATQFCSFPVLGILLHGMADDVPVLNNLGYCKEHVPVPHTAINPGILLVTL